MDIKDSDLIMPRENILDRSITYEKKIEESFYFVAKRIIDILGGIIGITALLPITAFVAISNIINREKGSIFFVQERIGKDGKTFKMYKYRTMISNADDILFKMLDENQEVNEEYKIHKKLKDDPRITKSGKFLRRTSLDEFPQFINVLKGEMSLVGPRPYLPREIDDMGMYYNYIIKQKPGITGFWQISGRSNITFEDRLKMDFDYYNKKSTESDIKLIIQTFLRIVKREGAI